MGRNLRAASSAALWLVASWLLRIIALIVAIWILLTALYSVVAPPTTIYMIQERIRLGDINSRWADMEDVPLHLQRAVVAAEDSNFCQHWGFDIEAISAAMDDNAGRGASTISQQVAKNVFLWQQRNWIRKMLEVPAVLAIEAAWSKRRILEVYVNVAEFDEGVFGVAEAAFRYYGREVGSLTEIESAQLAAVLPSPKTRNAASLAPELQVRAESILDGARTIAKDERSTCFAG